MLAGILIGFSGLLLVYYCFFAYYNYVYGFAALFRPKFKTTKPSGKKVAVVIVSYNEEHVILDTIRECEKLTYPNKVIIVGDDSTDGRTYPMLCNAARERGCKLVTKINADPRKSRSEWESKNFVIFHRHDNLGFKAGNLKELEEYLRNNNFEYMYLLDADWWPQPDAIERCLEVLEANDRLAFVQTKRRSYHKEMSFWEHCLALNEDGAYYVDLPGRQAVGDPMLFTGSCTMFRLDYLYEADGFTPGHLTEDIDLTNKLYLIGYKGVYLESVVNEGEVPPHYPAFRKQQERWAIGSAHAFRDYFSRILKSPYLSFKEKVGQLRQNAFFTTAIAIEISIVMAFITTLLVASDDSLQGATLRYYFSFINLPYSLLIFIALGSNFVAPLVTIIKTREWWRIVYMPFATWISWSLLHTYFISNLKGFFRIRSGWNRTPKGNRKKVVHPRSSAYHFKFVNLVTIGMLLVIYGVEWYVFGIIDPFAFFWVPALVTGAFLT